MSPPKSASGQGARQSWKARSPASAAGTCGLARKELPNRRDSGPGAGVGGQKEDVFKALGEMAKRFGTRAGESLPVWKRSHLAARGDHAVNGGLEILPRGNEGGPK